MIKKIKDFSINFYGLKTDRKLVVFLIDDYGTIRIDSLEALKKLEKIDPKISANRFNKYDALASTEDLIALFDVLSSVKDKNGNAAVFTPMTVVANPDFGLIEPNFYNNRRS